MPRTMNLRDTKAYRNKCQKGYLRAFSEAYIAIQPPETQKRMRQHNDKVRIARLVSKAKRKARKLEKEREREAIRSQRKADRNDRSTRQAAV